jgi:hypothetical protein
MSENKKQDSGITTPDYFLKKYYKHFCGEFATIGKTNLITFTRLFEKDGKPNVFTIKIEHYSEEVATEMMQERGFSDLDACYKLIFGVDPEEKND